MPTMAVFLPHLVMTISPLCLAGLLVILQSALDPSAGLSAIILVVYQQLLSSIVLIVLSAFIDRGRRPKITFEILCWTFLLGILRTPVGAMMLTASLKYITPTFQSVALNTVPVWVFIMAVILRREPFQFLGFSGQAKLWGIAISVAGATAMLMLMAPGQAGLTTSGINGQLVGALMAGVAVLSEASANVILETVALKYPADVSLSAMVTVFGTLQALVIGVLIERDSSAWKISWNRSLELVAIVYCGILVNGVMFFAFTWCIRKEGPVFVTAFSPLLVVFSFILQTIFGRVHENFASIVGALPVIAGLYLLLWAKSQDRKALKPCDNSQTHHPVDMPSKEPLLPK